MLKQGGLYRYQTSLKRFLRESSAGTDADVIALWQNYYTKNKSKILCEIKRNDICMILSEPETYLRSIYPEIKILTQNGIIGYIWFCERDWLEASNSHNSGSNTIK